MPLDPEVRARHAKRLAHVRQGPARTATEHGDFLAIAEYLQACEDLLEEMAASFRMHGVIDASRIADVLGIAP